MQATSLTSPLNSIKKQVLVQASQETAFHVFTQKIDLWWPKTHHVGSCAMVESVLECRQDGRWFSRHEDGSEVNIGKVLVWRPYDLLVLAWQIDGNFRYDSSLLTEVVVTFSGRAAAETLVTIEHRDIQKLAGGAKIVENMDEGWGMIMNLYKEVAHGMA